MSRAATADQYHHPHQQQLAQHVKRFPVVVVEVERVEECQAALEEFLTTRKADLLQKIADEKALSDEINDGLKTALEDFKGSWK